MVELIDFSYNNILDLVYWWQQLFYNNFFLCVVHEVVLLSIKCVENYDFLFFFVSFAQVLSSKSIL